MTVAERIAYLPVAANKVESFQTKLTQGNNLGQTKPVGSQISESMSDSNTSTTNASSLQKSLFAADSPEYTKADAVNKQWRKMNTVNLFELLDGTADMSNRNLSASDVEKMLQEGGLLDEVNDVDFSMLKFELSGLGFESSGWGYRSIASGEFDKNVQYLASRYVAMEDKIKTLYTGTEQKERLDKLNEMYHTTLEKEAKSYSDIIGGILEDYGSFGEKEKIYQSFKNGVAQKVEEYREILKENRGFTAELEGTEDEWLLKDDEYIAARLREQKTVYDTKESQAGDYSLRELDVLGQYASGLSAMAAKANTYEMNEERIGLDFAVLAMKTDTLQKEGSMSSAFYSTLQDTFNRYLKVFLEQFNRKLEENRKNAETAYCVQGNVRLDEDAVWSVYNKTMERYRISNDAMDALLTGARYGKEQYSKKMNYDSMQEVYRYKNGGAYWNHFFENVSDKKTNLYTKKGTTFEQYMAGWLDFKDSIREGNHSVHMNLLLRPKEFYSIGQNGNLLNANG